MGNYGTVDLPEKDDQMGLEIIDNSKQPSQQVIEDLAIDQRPIQNNDFKYEMYNEIKSKQDSKASTKKSDQRWYYLGQNTDERKNTMEKGFQLKNRPLVDQKNSTGGNFNYSAQRSHYSIRHKMGNDNWRYLSDKNLKSSVAYQMDQKRNEDNCVFHARDPLTSMYYPQVGQPFKKFTTCYEDGYIFYIFIIN